MELTTNYYPEAPYILIGIGCAIIIVGTLGCCCTVKGHSILLYVFSVFLVIVFVAELAAGISGFIFKNKLESGFQKGLKGAFETYDSKPESKKDIDDLQKGLKCCGMNNATNWNKYPHGKIPESCCKTANCDVKIPENVYQEGCYKIVTEFMKSNFSIIGGSVIGVSFSDADWRDSSVLPREICQQR